MLDWFPSRAPLDRKLELAFGAVSLSIAFAGGLAGGACTQLLKASRNASPDLRHAALMLALVVVATTALVFAASLLIGWATRRTVCGPLRLLVRRIEELAAGDLDSPIGFADHEDEAGRLSRAMRRLQADAAERGRLRAECDERGRMIAVLLDSYYRLAAADAAQAVQADGPRGAGLRSLEAIFARAEAMEEGGDLRRLLRRLGSGARVTASLRG